MKKVLLTAAALIFSMAAMNAQTEVKDPFVYEPVDGYVLKNLWIKSVKTLNDPSAALGEARGMAALNGELLFCRRDGDPSVSSIDIYDGMTGAFKKNVALASDVFVGAGIPCNDIQVDDAGNVLVANLATDVVKGGFQVWKIDITTGIGTKVIQCNLPLLENGEATPVIRIDAFGVYGDVNGDGYVMAAVAGAEAGIGDQILRWDIKGGKVVVSLTGGPETTENPADYPEMITIQEYYPSTTPSNGTAPRVCPIDNDLFYLDGFNTAAAIYDMSGILIDSFEKAPDLAPKQVGNNGVDEFSLDGRNFIIYSYTNTVDGTSPQAWALCDVGENMTFEGMKKQAIFPGNGLGNVSNPVRTALPRIDVKEDAKVAVIYVYAYKSGFGAYVFGEESAVDKFINPKPDGISDINTANLKISVTENGVTVSEAAEVTVYDFTGQQIAAQSNATHVTLLPGNYIVKAVSVDGKSVSTSKVLIK